MQIKANLEELGIQLYSQDQLIVIEQADGKIQFEPGDKAQQVIDAILTVNYGIRQRMFNEQRRQQIDRSTAVQQPCNKR